MEQTSAEIPNQFVELEAAKKELKKSKIAAVAVPAPFIGIAALVGFGIHELIPPPFEYPLYIAAAAAIIGPSVVMGLQWIEQGQAKIEKIQNQQAQPDPVQ